MDDDPDFDDLEEINPGPVGRASIPYGVEDRTSYRPAVGQSNSPPLWEHADSMPTIEQLGVWLDREGRLEWIGRITARASMSEFVERFRAAMIDNGHPRGGEFVLRPLDADGRHTGRQFRHRVSRHAPELLQAAAAPPGAPVGPSVSPFDLPPWMEAERERLHAEMIAQAAKIERERQEIAAQREELATERIALASNAAAGVQAVSERMMESDAQRQQAQINTLQGFFQQQMAMMSALQSQQQQQHERAIERERIAYERADRERADRLERERERERAAREAEAARAARELERYKADQDAALQRERAHAERMIALQQAQSENNGLNGVFSVLSQFGKEPGDFLKALTGSNEGGESTLSTLIKVGGEVAKSIAETSAATARAEEASARADAEEMALLDGYEPAPAMIGTGTGGPAAPIPFPQQQQQQQQTDPNALPDPAGMPPADCAKARKGIAILTQRLQSEDEDQWVDILTMFLVKYPAILPYVRAHSISAAIREGGGSDRFVAQFVAAVDASPLVPKEIPR